MIKLADGRGLLYQWDTGRQVECDAEQVHFSNHHYGTSIDVDVQNGKATIPNQLLTSATPIKAWAWVKDSNGEYTKEEQIFIVAKRNKPSDYVYTPTEIKTWQDLQNQIGDLSNLTTAHKDNLVNAINDAAGSGGGASDFIIKMTVEDNNDDGYTVTSCDATVEQIDAAVAAEKRVVLIVSVDGAIIELPMVQGVKGNVYYFGACLGGLMMISFVYKADGNTSNWEFNMNQIQSEDVDYSNAALPSVTNVKTALNALVPKSHTHANKDTLDKLSVSNGKLQYNGSDVGLKGGKGADGKSAYQYAHEGGYTGTETEFAKKLASGALFVEIMAILKQLMPMAFGKKRSQMRRGTSAFLERSVITQSLQSTSRLCKSRRNIF